MDKIVVRQVQKADADTVRQMKEPDVLLWSSDGDEINIIFRSSSKQVRALEFMDYFLVDCGICKGNESIATGAITSSVLDMLISQSRNYGAAGRQNEDHGAGSRQNEDHGAAGRQNETYATGGRQSIGCDTQMAQDADCRTQEYFEERAKAYFDETDICDAKSFDIARFAENELKTYSKKNKPWAYVKSTDIADEGDEIILKSLENESGICTAASDDTYIMIGLRGEVYDISSEKFHATYSMSDEKLDIFMQMMEFIPEVRLKKTGEFVSIDEKAYICRPKGGNEIYAVCLEKRTKVFYGADGQEYFLGRPGDYLAIRKDDTRDVYIIRRSIFEQTYEMV